MSEYEKQDRLEREPTVEDIHQLMGASSPHFALQIRNRIQNLIAGLPPTIQRALPASARSRASSGLPSMASTAALPYRASESYRASAAPDVDGTARAHALLTDELRADKPPGSNGYIDLLPPEGLPSTGLTQNLMLTRVVPEIYERWWRPALGRVAKGVFGPGMAEERRIARLLLGLVPGDGVLDIACGTGNFTRDFARTVGSRVSSSASTPRPRCSRARSTTPAAWSRSRTSGATRRASRSATRASTPSAASPRCICLATR